MRFLIFLLCIFPHFLFSQELNCRVIVDAQQVQITERGIFEDMEKEFALFMNTTKWTNDTYSEEEVIKCNILITISEMPSIGVFNASVQVLSSRPVYGTNYETIMLNFADRNFNFNYVESQPIRFNPNTFTDQISSLLAYYAYIIIGFDYDSFEDLGGTPYFEKAFDIVNNAQSSGFEGWTQFNSTRNRYWLIENIINPQLEPVRKANYNYHRLGLDRMAQQQEEAEKSILEALSDVRRANRARPRSILTISFMDAKATEIVKMFGDSALPTRRQAYNLLINIDPARTDQYKKLIE